MMHEVDPIKYLNFINFMNKVTEADSHYDSLEQIVQLIYSNINNEDEKVARIVKQQIPSIVSL